MRVYCSCYSSDLEMIARDTLSTEFALHGVQCTHKFDKYHDLCDVLSRFRRYEGTMCVQARLESLSTVREGGLAVGRFLLHVEKTFSLEEQRVFSTRRYMHGGRRWIVQLRNGKPLVRTGGALYPLARAWNLNDA